MLTCFANQPIEITNLQLIFALYIKKMFFLIYFKTTWRLVLTKARLAPVVKSLHRAILGIINIQQISIRKINCGLQWIDIYPVDSAIHLLNNWGKVSYMSNTKIMFHPGIRKPKRDVKTLRSVDFCKPLITRESFVKHG